MYVCVCVYVIVLPFFLVCVLGCNCLFFLFSCSTVSFVKSRVNVPHGLGKGTCRTRKRPHVPPHPPMDDIYEP